MDKVIVGESYWFIYKGKEISGTRGSDTVLVKHLSNNHRMGVYYHWTHALEAIDDWINAQG
jgi:hypothetical protein